MRILAFNYEYPPLGGGGGVVFQQIIEVLSRRHEITVVTTGYRGLPRQETEGNIRIVRVPVIGRTKQSTANLASMVSYFPSSLLRGRALLKGQQFDLINSHFVVPSAPSAHILAGRYSLPHVLSIHGGDLYDPSKKLSPHGVPILRGLVGRLLGGADRLVAQSRNTAENARKHYRISRSIDIIPLGIKRPVFRRMSRTDMQIGRDRFVIVTVGRLIARKALDDLLRVIADLNDSRLLLLILGDGPKQGMLERLSEDLGIGNQIRFLGRVDEEKKWQLLSMSDLYASTSLHEGFGLVFLEAFHCGLPVVAYDHGGQTDFIEDGVSGSLVPLGRHEAYVEAMHRWISSDDDRSRIGAANRELVKEYYIDRCADRYEALFQETVSNRASRIIPNVGRSR